MSVFAATTFMTQLSVSTQSRLLPCLWLRRNVVRCLSNKADGSGLPVRYVPKKGREVDQTQHSTFVNIAAKDGMSSSSSSSAFRRKSFDGVKGLHIGRNEEGSTSEGEKLNAEGKQPNVVLDATCGTGPELNQWNGHCKEVTDKVYMKARSQVVEGTEASEVVTKEAETYKKKGPNHGRKLSQVISNDGLVDEEYLEAPEEAFEETHLNNWDTRDQNYRAKQDAQKFAVELLAKRAFTVVELRKKLNAKQLLPNVVESVLCDFQDRGLINDGLYAETFSQSRWESSSWGPRRIKQALTKKGVNHSDVEKAVKLVFEDTEGDQRSGITLSNSSLHQLYVQASKQWQRSVNVPHEKRKVRVIRWLQYRGFDWGVVGTILKKLESECP